jgi:hypothetical protein
MVETVWDFLLNAVLFVVGAGLVLFTLNSAIHTFVLPRAARDGLTYFVFRVVRILFELRIAPSKKYVVRDRIMALYAPVAVLALLPTWYMLVMLGYSLMFWAFGAKNWYLAFRDSGSSLLTLGFESVNTVAFSILAFSEATIGLLLVALLIAYLPTMYSAFSRREKEVTLLEVRAGDPPSAIEMIKRYHRIHGLEKLGAVWERWEVWFAEIEESHTSLPALAFFRSPRGNHSWLTAGGTVLDAAALTLAVVDIPQDWRANLCLRAGSQALNRIAAFFDVPYNREPQPGDHISIGRAEFDMAVDELVAQGVPIKGDREQAWCDFSGWRANYDQALVGLADYLMAPASPWITDRPVE